MSNEISTIKSEEIYEEHKIWGIIGILIMLFSGIVTIPPFLFYLILGRHLFKERYWSSLDASSTKSKKGEIFGTIFGVCTMLFYPIAMICASFAALCKALSGKGSESWKLSTLMMGQEAFCESFPQILLQCYTIAYGYQITIVQKVTIFESFFLLARVAIVYDLLGDEKELSFK